MNPDSLFARSLLTAAHRDGESAALRCRMLLERAVASQAWHLALQGALARAGLTEVGFAVLAALAPHHPRPMRRTGIAMAAGLSPARAGGALARLELSGLVERPRDRRTGCRGGIRLTAAGARQIGTALRQYVQAAKRVTRQLDRRDVERAIVICGKIRHGAAQLARANTGADSP